MLSVTLTCSDEQCEIEVEALVAFPAEIDVLVCDSCGCTLQALAFSEAGEVTSARRAALPLAA